MKNRQISVALFASFVLASSLMAQTASAPLAAKDPEPLVQPFSSQALELQPGCVRAYVYEFSDAFKSQSKMALPNCYTDPKDSMAIVRLVELIKTNPKQSRDIAKIVKSWTDYRSQCAIKQTAYVEAVADVEAFILESSVVAAREARGF
ncbi:MAG: hypothetical protein CVT75_06430 [Alphaproteobacteria bacterium HGW-Alphaproteobacteria-14]|nr:MAG: hypothetical protein CVT75_06430 [Alphaproteobacteria bacterium HGW-Alphaproteobacteria-14]